MLGFGTCQALTPVPDGQNKHKTLVILESFLCEFLVCAFVVQADACAKAARPYQGAGEFHAKIIGFYEPLEPFESKTKLPDFLIADNVRYVRLQSESPPSTRIAHPTE